MNKCSLRLNRRAWRHGRPISAFVRIAAHPHATDALSPRAWQFVEAWLAAPTATVPLPTEEHAHVLGGLIWKYRLAGNAVRDGHVAALAIEHGLEVTLANTDFARFTELRWINPIAD